MSALDPGDDVRTVSAMATAKKTERGTKDGRMHLRASAEEVEAWQEAAARSEFGTVSQLARVLLNRYVAANPPPKKKKT